MVKEIIANSELIYTDTPKTNKGQKMFSKILVLVAAVRGIGWAKLTIGKYNDKAEWYKLHIVSTAFSICLYIP